MCAYPAMLLYLDADHPLTIVTAQSYSMDRSKQTAGCDNDSGEIIPLWG